MGSGASKNQNEDDSDKSDDENSENEEDSKSELNPDENATKKVKKKKEDWPIDTDIVESTMNHVALQLRELLTKKQKRLNLSNLYQYIKKMSKPKKVKIKMISTLKSPTSLLDLVSNPGKKGK